MVCSGWCANGASLRSATPWVRYCKQNTITRYASIFCFYHDSPGSELPSSRNKNKNPLAGVIVFCLILDPAEVEIRGIEPLTSWLPVTHSSQLSYIPVNVLQKYIKNCYIQSQVRATCFFKGIKWQSILSWIQLTQEELFHILLIVF